MKKVCSILILIVLLLNSPVMVLISQAVEAVSEIISTEGNSIQSTQDVAIEKYINYANNLERGTMVQLKVGVGLQKELQNKDVYINQTIMTVECPKISEKVPARVEVIGKDAKYENGIITIEEKYEQKLKYEGKKEYTVILFYDADCYTDVNEERMLEAKVSVSQTLESDKTSTSSEENIVLQGEASTQMTVTENVGTVVSVNYETETIYNGYINANIENGTAYDTEYQETAKVMISNKNIAESFIVSSNNVFGFQDNEISNNSNLLYKNITIEKSKVEDILGENGEIKILGQDDNILSVINKETETVEDGKYVYTFNEPVENIKLQISDIAKEGTIEFNTTKIIKSTLLQNVDVIKNRLNISGTQTTIIKSIDETSQQEVESEQINTIYVENLENSIAIQNATQNISMDINKQELTNKAQNEITLTATLEKNKAKDKLFENPIVYIEFPEEVEKIILKDTQVLHDVELTKQDAVVETNAEGKQVIKVSLAGKQTRYTKENDITKGTNILISATVMLKQNITSKESSIKMVCNEATYEKAIRLVERNQIKAKAQSNQEVEGTVVNSNGLRIDTKVIAGDRILSDNETIYEEQILKYEVKITNTTDNNIDNIKVVGKVPEGMTYVDLVEGTFYYENYEFVPNTEIKQKEIEVGTLSAGQTETYYYEVKVNDLLDTETQKETISDVKVYIGDAEVSTYSLTNIISQADIAVELKNVEGRGRRNEIIYFAKISNISNVDQKNVIVNIPLLKNLDIEETLIWGQEGEIVSEPNDPNVFVKFNNIKKFENSGNTDNSEDEEGIGFKVEENEVGVYIRANVVNVEENDDYSWSINTIATATAEDGRVYRSNENRATGYIEAVTVEQKLDIKKNGEILPLGDGETLRSGDEVIYTIKIENVGDVTEEWGKYTKVTLTDYIPRLLRVNAITYNTNIISSNPEEYEQKIIITPQENVYVPRSEINEMNNNITDEPRLKLDLYIRMNEVSTITINTTVGLIPEDAKIKNYATVTGEFIQTKTSNTIENTIKGYMVDDTEKIEDPSKPDKPDQPDQPDPPDNPDTKKYAIQGLAWIDENENGQREETEQRLPGVEVMLLDITKNQYVQNENGDIIIKTTNNDGQYSFENVDEGKYYVVFKYNNEDYEITTYQKSEVSSEINSDAMRKETMLNNETVYVGLTDIINLTSNRENIDIGLIKNKIFDLKVEKYIQKITVQNSKGTKQYNYNNEKIAKIEIPAKQIANSTIAIEYKIVVTNVGELAGTVNELIDEMPYSLEFNSELNSNWYRTIGNNLGNASLAKQEIKAGESVETTIVLTKKLDDTIQTYTNIAKIGISDNEKHISDMNLSNDSDKVEIIVSIQTGTIGKYVGTVIASILAIAIILYITLIIMKKFNFGKGPKIGLFIALILAIIPASNFVKSYTEEEQMVINEYGTTMNISWHVQANQNIYLVDGDRKIYGCIDPGKTMCWRDHKYELIDVKVEEQSVNTPSIEQDFINDNASWMSGQMNDSYEYTGYTGVGDDKYSAGCMIKNRKKIEKITETGSKIMYGPFKLQSYEVSLPAQGLKTSNWAGAAPEIQASLRSVTLLVYHKRMDNQYQIQLTFLEEGATNVAMYYSKVDNGDRNIWRMACL